MSEVILLEYTGVPGLANTCSSVASSYSTLCQTAFLPLAAAAISPDDIQFNSGRVRRLVFCPPPKPRNARKPLATFSHSVENVLVPQANQTCRYRIPTGDPRHPNKSRRTSTSYGFMCPLRRFSAAKQRVLRDRVLWSHPQHFRSITARVSFIRGVEWSRGVLPLNRRRHQGGGRRQRSSRCDTKTAVITLVYAYRERVNQEYQKKHAQHQSGGALQSLMYC